MFTKQTRELLRTFVSYKVALKEAENYTTKNLLLDIGFSIDCLQKVNYKSLFQEADFQQRNHIKSIFQNLDTEDFEVVLSSLETVYNIIKAYNLSFSTYCNLENDSNIVRRVLLDTIAQIYPQNCGTGKIVTLYNAETAKVWG